MKPILWFLPKKYFPHAIRNNIVILTHNLSYLADMCLWISFVPLNPATMLPIFVTCVWIGMPSQSNKLDRLNCWVSRRASLTQWLPPEPAKAKHTLKKKKLSQISWNIWMPLPQLPPAIARQNYKLLSLSFSTLHSPSAISILLRDMAQHQETQLGPFLGTKVPLRDLLETGGPLKVSFFKGPF